MVLKVEGRRKHFSVGQAKYMQWRLYRGCETADYPREARNTFRILEFGFSGTILQTSVRRSLGLPDLFCRPWLLAGTDREVFSTSEIAATDRILKAQSVMGRD